MRFAPQSSPPWCRLPASATLLLALLAPPLAGQSPVRLEQETRIYKSPGAQVLGSLAAGAEVQPGRASGRAVEVTIEGWIYTRSLGPLNRDGFNAAVTAQPSENLRAAPNGAVIARLIRGAGLVKVETRGEWTRVRRTAWVDQKLLGARARGDAGGSGPPPQAGASRAEVIRRTPVSVVPGAAPVGTVDSGVVAGVLARSGGWTRLQLEVWVPDTTLASTPAGVLVGVSQAEVRANPARFVGQVLEWRLQFVAVQKADELRPEIPEGASYLLTRGPLPEPGFVYVMIPADQVARFQALPPLKEIVVRGTLRAASTKYLPTPVLQLVEVVEGLGS